MPYRCSLLASVFQAEYMTALKCHKGEDVFKDYLARCGGTNFNLLTFLAWRRNCDGAKHSERRNMVPQHGRLWKSTRNAYKGKRLKGHSFQMIIYKYKHNYACNIQFLPNLTPLKVTVHKWAWVECEYSDLSNSLRQISCANLQKPHAWCKCLNISAMYIMLNQPLWNYQIKWNLSYIKTA